ncbi:MAG: hypothetical protein ACFFGZ_06020 [Candidatus Thorarchaeota archaeon]
MIFPQVVQRSVLSLKRYQFVVSLAILAFTGLFLGYGLFYPGKEGLEAYLSLDYLQIVLGSLDVENPGYLVWILISTLLLQMYLPIGGIFLGGYFLPLMEKDGKEVLLTTPISARRQFLENAIIGFGLLWIICLPAYLTAIGLASLNNAAEGIPNITIAFVLAIMLTSVFMYATAFGAALTFSRKMGYFIGAGAYAATFLLQMSGNEVNEKFGELSLMYRAQVFKHSLEKTWNTEFILLTIILNGILIYAALLFLQRNDYIENSSELVPQRLKRTTKTFQSISQRPLRRLGWASPAIRDQFHANAAVFAVFLFFTTFIVVYVVPIYQSNKEEMEATISSFNSPLFQAFMFGRELEASLENFLAMELFAFAWMIHGVFLLIVVNSIITRDYKSYADITWQLPKSQGEILTNRAIAAIIYFFIIFLSNGLALFLALILTGLRFSVLDAFLAFFVAAWAYSVFVLFFMAVSLIPPIKHAQKTLLISYGLSIMILALAFLLDIPWMRYISPFGYFDIVGILIGDLNLWNVLIEAIIGTLIAITLFMGVLKVRLPTKDLV